MRGWSRQKESMEPMQRTGSPVWKVCKGGRAPGATSLCRLCWPEGWSQGMLKAHPGCGPVLTYSGAHGKIIPGDTAEAHNPYPPWVPDVFNVNQRHI